MVQPMIPHWAGSPSLYGVIVHYRNIQENEHWVCSIHNLAYVKHVAKAPNKSILQESLNMSIMFTMSNTLPGTYVKHVAKAPNKSMLQESLNMSIIFTMSNTLPGTYVKHVQKTPNFVYLTRDQSLLYPFFYSSLLCSSEKILQPVWRRQVPNWVASWTSLAGWYFLTYGTGDDHLLWSTILLLEIDLGVFS
jgi:hypothetical protein